VVGGSLPYRMTPSGLIIVVIACVLEGGVIPHFHKYVEGLGVGLSCCNCRSEMIHHISVEVFDREEDHATGVHVVIAGQKVSVDSSQDGNPSRRRQGLRVVFECEICTSKTALSILQHKGGSYLDVVPLPLV